MILKTCDEMNMFNADIEAWKSLEDVPLCSAFDRLVDWVLENEEEMSVYDNPWDIVDEAKQLIIDRGLEAEVSNKRLFEDRSDYEEEVIAVHTLNLDGKTFTLREVAPPKF